MSEENVETVRQVLELFRERGAIADTGLREGDLAKALELFHPAFELDATRVPMTDLRGRFRGMRDVMEFWTRWLEAWDSLQFEDELTDAGDCVLAEMKQRMRGKGSGIEIEFPPHWQVFSFRKGRIIGQAFFLDEAEAREAAGLSEYPLPRGALDQEWG
jgi:ketosteroid isomerase-like protein